MSISVHLAQVLEAGRAQFNSRVVEAKHRYPALDTSDFSSFLQTSIDPVVAAVAAAAPEQSAAVAIAAYDIGLELVGQRLAGPSARHELVDKVWQNVVPHHINLLVEDPYELLGMLSNAALNLLKVSNARTEQWIGGMIALSQHTATFSQLRSTGQVMAWRAGLAHFRIGALSAADQLPETLALAAVGAKGNEAWPEVKSKFLSDPWWSPEVELATESSRKKIVIETGEFSGFGGKFHLPPEVRANDDGFCIKSGDQYFHLTVDIFGAVLLAATQEEFETAKLHHDSRKLLLQGSTVMLSARKIILDLPAEGLSLSSNEHTVVASSPYSFSLQIFPLNY